MIIVSIILTIRLFDGYLDKRNNNLHLVRLENLYVKINPDIYKHDDD